MAIGTLVFEINSEKKKIVDDLQLTLALKKCQSDAIQKLPSLIDGEISSQKTLKDVRCFKDIISCTDFLLEILIEGLPERPKKGKEEECIVM